MGGYRIGKGNRVVCEDDWRHFGEMERKVEDSGYYKILLGLWE
jgi:hypothetical protein